MGARFPRFIVLGALMLSLSLAFAATPVGATSTPSGERMLAQNAIEPVYDDMTGDVAYVATPIHVANPVHANPKSWAPFYITVYPTGSTVGTLDCVGIPGNCPRPRCSHRDRSGAAELGVRVRLGLRQRGDRP